MPGAKNIAASPAKDTKPGEVTPEQIAQLRSVAGQDSRQLAICQKALDGDARALAECAVNIDEQDAKKSGLAVWWSVVKAGGLTGAFFGKQFDSPDAAVKAITKLTGWVSPVVTQTKDATLVHVDSATQSKDPAGQRAFWIQQAGG